MLFAELGVSGNFVKNAERKWRLENQERQLRSKKELIEDLSKRNKVNNETKLTPTGGPNTPTAQLVKPMEKSSSDKKEVLKVDG